MTGALALAMFPVAALAIVLSGAPVFLLLVAVALAFALGGAALGQFDLGLLAALPARLVGLLEHDLLQALALYALVGALLHRLRLGTLWLRTAAHALRGTRAGAALATLGLAALTAPMTGSVGASLALLLRTAAPRLQAEGVPPARATALLAVAGTLGVIVPPSLVLLLLGDAMMRAHTEALQRWPGAAVQVMNNQQLIGAALWPGLALLAAWLACAALSARAAPAGALASASAPEPAPSRADRLTTLALGLAVPALLAAVAAGRLYAVEAAALAGLALLAWGTASGQLRGQWAAMLDEAMRLTGMVFGLLVGATAFTLVLRGFGTDAWLAGALAALPGGPPLALAVVMALLALAATVLDAFEIIFLVVPVVMPPLLALLPAAAPRVAVLALLVLQAGYLLPPLGYAVLLARGAEPAAAGGAHGQASAVARALLPYLASLALVLAAVWLWTLQAPAAVPAAATPTAPAAATVDADELLRQQSQPRRGDAPP